MSKEVNVYSFYDECYVHFKDYKKLQQRIDKAIEYIDNSPTLDYGTTKEFNIKEFPFVQHILEILKGDNDE